LLVLLVSSTIAAAEIVFESTSDDQVAVELTIYNDNLALVKETRIVKLPVGEGKLNFRDIASYIMPVTVCAESLNYPKDFVVLEQTYEDDLISANKLLDGYVGEKIKIINWNEFQDRKDVVEATLLSNDQEQIYEINGEIYIGYPGYKVLPKVPENLIIKPTLEWLYDNKTEKAHRLEVSYLTSNMNWKADYVVILNEDNSYADISSWVTLDNKSGATYENVLLTLISGEVRRIEQKPEERLYMMKSAAEVENWTFEESSFFEYHLYGLPRKTTIKDKQTKQLILLEAVGVGTEKELIAYGNKDYFTRVYSQQIIKNSVNVNIKFKNSKDNDLGVPLPAGIMRLYQKDVQGKLQFIGEDKIEHTPKDEEIKLRIGEAFDVVVERIQVDYKKITTKLHESEWEITLRNHKEKDVIIGVVESLLGNWQIISNTHPYEKIDASTIRFNVNIPQDGEAKVRYKVRIGL